MVRGTTVGGLSAKYCLSVSESIVAVMLLVVVEVESRLVSSKGIGGGLMRAQ